MKTIRTALLIAAGITILSTTGCGRAKVSDAEYGLVWQIYTSREFEDGFYEKLSSEQKRKIFSEAASKAGVDVSGLASFMKEQHPQAYSQIFE